MALVLVDVINPMAFDGGEALATQAAGIVEPLLTLRRAAHHAGCPVVYANDNYGDWRATSTQLVQRCSRARIGGRFTRALKPTNRDLFVLKARNSAFYCTSLEPLLEAFGVKTVVLGGLSADNCVLFTAHDAYLRDFSLVVPADCSASCSAQAERRAMEQLAVRLKADIRPARSLRLPTLLRH